MKLNGIDNTGIPVDGILSLYGCYNVQIADITSLAFG